MAEPRGDSKTLQDYISVLKRRKWVIILAMVVVPVVAVVFSLRQSPLYSASADVLIVPGDADARLPDGVRPIVARVDWPRKTPWRPCAMGQPADFGALSAMSRSAPMACPS